MEKTTEKEYKLAPISEKQIKALGVQALADRPNAATGYGQSGFSPAQLKLWFDKLVTLAAGKINELQEVITGEDAAKYIGLALENYKTLDELIAAMQDGRFASDFLMVYPSAASFELSTLQDVLNAAAQIVSEHEESIKDLKKNKIDRTDLWDEIVEWRDAVVEDAKKMNKDAFVRRMPEIDKEVENDPNYKFAYDFAKKYNRVYVEKSGGGWNGNGGGVYNKYVLTEDGTPVYDPDFKDYKVDENGKPCGEKLDTIPMRLGRHSFMRVPPYRRAQIAALGLSESERKQLTAPIVYVDETLEIANAKAEVYADNVKTKLEGEISGAANAVIHKKTDSLLILDDISPLAKSALVSGEGGTDFYVSGANFAYEDTVTSKGTGEWKAYTMKVYPPKNRKYILSCDFENVTGLNIGIAVKQDDSSAYPNWWKEVDSTEASGSLSLEVEGGDYATCVALKFYSNSSESVVESECIFKNIVFRLADMEVPAGTKGCKQTKYTTDTETGNVTVPLPDVDKVLIYNLDGAEISATYAIDTNKGFENHNNDNTAHADIRTLISELTTRLNTVANSDDVTLDQMKELVDYIKSNRSLIDAITTSKAPTSHASTGTTYGAGSGTNYGHVKLSDATNSNSGASGGVAATPAAVKNAYDLAYGANAAVGALKTETWTFTLADGSTVTKAVYVG